MPLAPEKLPLVSLNPHVVGRFFRVKFLREHVGEYGLNPHVVGRFFRVQAIDDVVTNIVS